MQARRHPGPDAVITHARPSRSVDRNRRTRNYIIAMALRIACFVGLVAIPIPWVRIAMVVGAAFLPGFAVMAANFVDKRRQPPVLVEPGEPEARPQVGDHVTIRSNED